MKHTLEDDHHCFVCGKKNPAGLHLEFTFFDGKVRSEFVPEKVLQGYKDIVHGGIIAAVLDEAMVKAALMRGMPAVTAEITVRFKNPLMIGERAVVEAEIVSSNKKIVAANATVRKTDNTPIAQGRAKLLRHD